MKEQEAKELEQLVAKMMQKTSLENPSFQFTDKVMAAVNAQSQSITARYKPLFPKYIWVAIALAIMGITAYLWFLIQPAPINWSIPSLDLIKNNAFSKEVSAINPSKITGYAVMLFALMLCIQIPMLKRYFDKRQFL